MAGIPGIWVASCYSSGLKHAADEADMMLRAW